MTRGIVINQLVTQFRRKLNCSFLQKVEIARSIVVFKRFDEAHRPISFDGTQKWNNGLSFED